MTNNSSPLGHNNGPDTKNTPLCSVCIANYNGEKYLASCIESVLQQDFTYPVEIIIHDDASTDNSIQLIKKHYPQVQLLRSSINVGFCKSNNRMVNAANGKFILLLNNDATLHKGALETLYDASIRHGDGIFGLPQYDAQTKELIDIGSLFDLFLNPIPNNDSTKENVGMITGACLWLPKNLWDILGGFPDWFGSLAEDLYLCSLARLRGFQVRAIARSGFDHWVGRSLGGGKVTKDKKLSTTLKRRATSERNKSFVMIMCYPSFFVYILVPLHIFLLCIEGILLSLIKFDTKLWYKIYWNCLKAIWIHRQKLSNCRRLIQAKRQSNSTAFFSPFKYMPHKLNMLLRHGMPHIIK